MFKFRYLICTAFMITLVGCGGSGTSNIPNDKATGSIIDLDENTDPRFSVLHRSGTIGVIKPAGKRVFQNGANIRRRTRLNNNDYVYTESNSAARLEFHQNVNACEINVTEFNQGRLYGFTNQCNHQVDATHSVSRAGVGNTRYQIEVAGSVSTLTVVSGSVMAWPAANSAQAVVVNPGTESTFTRNAVQSTRQLSAEELREKTKWRDRYDFEKGKAKSKGLGTTGALLLGIGAAVLGKKIYDHNKDRDDDRNDPGSYPGTREPKYPNDPVDRQPQPKYPNDPGSSENRPQLRSNSINLNNIFQLMNKHLKRD